QPLRRLPLPPSPSPLPSWRGGCAASSGRPTSRTRPAPPSGRSRTTASAASGCSAGSWPVPQGVTDAPHRVDELPRPRPLDFLAQQRDVDINRVGRRPGGLLPDVAGDHIAGDGGIL